MKNGRGCGRGRGRGLSQHDMVVRLYRSQFFRSLFKHINGIDIGMPITSRGIDAMVQWGRNEIPIIYLHDFLYFKHFPEEMKYVCMVSTSIFSFHNAFLDEEEEGVILQFNDEPRVLVPLTKTNAWVCLQAVLALIEISNRAQYSIFTPTGDCLAKNRECELFSCEALLNASAHILGLNEKKTNSTKRKKKKKKKRKKKKKKKKKKNRVNRMLCNTLQVNNVLLAEKSDLQSSFSSSSSSPLPSYSSPSSSLSPFRSSWNYSSSKGNRSPSFSFALELEEGPDNDNDSSPLKSVGTTSDQEGDDDDDDNTGTMDHDTVTEARFFNSRRMQRINRRFECELLSLPQRWVKDYLTQKGTGRFYVCVEKEEKITLRAIVIIESVIPSEVYDGSLDADMLLKGWMDNKSRIWKCCFPGVICIRNIPSDKKGFVVGYLKPREHICDDGGGGGDDDDDEDDWQVCLEIFGNWIRHGRGWSMFRSAEVHEMLRTQNDKMAQKLRILGSAQDYIRPLSPSKMWKLVQAGTIINLQRQDDNNEDENENGGDNQDPSPSLRAWRSRLQKDFPRLFYSQDDEENKSRLRYHKLRKCHYHIVDVSPSWRRAYAIQAIHAQVGAYLHSLLALTPERLNELQEPSNLVIRDDDAGKDPDMKEEDVSLDNSGSNGVIYDIMKKRLETSSKEVPRVIYLILLYWWDSFHEHIMTKQILFFKYARSGDSKKILTLLNSKKGKVQDIEEKTHEGVHKQKIRGSYRSSSSSSRSSRKKATGDSLKITTTTGPKRQTYINDIKIDFRDSWGTSVFGYALKYGHKKIVSIIQEKTGQTMTPQERSQYLTFNIPKRQRARMRRQLSLPL
eukprot:jgi/Bigna1/139191/aug1.49_g13899